MYENDIWGKSYAVANQAGELVRKPDITLRENIDGQIAMAEKRLKELQEAKSRLEKSAIIDMRIDDIQSAMRW